jgi:predicted permease
VNAERRRWLRLRWRSLFRPRVKEAELDAELRFHFEHLVEDYIAAGLSPAEARREARKEFGHSDPYREACRDSWGGHIFQDVLHDLRYGLRQLNQARGFTLIAALTLAIGIGATTAIFSIFNSVVLRPLDYVDSHELVEIRRVRAGTQEQTAVRRLAAFQHWEQHATSYSDLAAYSYLSGNMTGIEHPIRLVGQYVTPNLFHTLEVRPILGRNFTAEDALPGRTNVFILSYNFWQEQFGGSRDVLDRTIRFSDQSFTIIGVLPRGVHDEPHNPQVFAPLNQNVDDPTRRGLMNIVGRLKEGVTLAQAQAEMDVLAEQLARANPALWDGVGTRVIPMLDYHVRSISSPLYMLLGAVVFLLLIACVNVANLTLARASTRQREIAVRAALGASRARIIRQLLAESTLLALIGGACGIVLAYGMLPVLLEFAPVAMPRMDEVRIDGATLVFSCVITMLTGIGFGLMPALQGSKVDLTTSIKDGGRSVGSSRRGVRLRHALVVAEVSLAMILLAGAGLLTRSFAKLQETNLGFNPNHIYAARLQLEPHRYPNTESQHAFIDQALEQIAAQPGIEAASFSSALPFYRVFEIGMDIETNRQDPNRLPMVGFFGVTPDYFAVTQTKLLEGRLFTNRDRGEGPPVVIISKRLADQYFPGVSPVRRRITVTQGEDRPWFEIVGVVEEVRHRGAPTISSPQFYMPLHQSFIPVRIMFAVRNQEGAPNPAARVAAAIHAVNPDIAVAQELVNLSVYANNALSLHRFCLFLFSVFSAIAVLLAALGIYGVVSYTVNQRTNEIGVRMAHGAQPGDIMRLIVHRAAVMVGIGMLIGFTGALTGSRLLNSVLHEVSPQDPLTLATISAALALVAMTACFIPARRAVKVNPMIALRSE